MKKNEAEKNKVIITFPKPPQDKFGASAKIVRMRTVIGFVAEMGKYPMNDDPVAISIITDGEGNMDDAKWFRDNVLRFVDIDKEGADRVEKLIAKYNEVDPKHMHKADAALIRLQSQEIYIPISIWKVE